MILRSRVRMKKKLNSRNSGGLFQTLHCFFEYKTIKVLHIYSFGILQLRDLQDISQKLYVSDMVAESWQDLRNGHCFSRNDSLPKIRIVFVRCVQNPQNKSHVHPICNAMLEFNAAESRRFWLCSIEFRMSHKKSIRSLASYNSIVRKAVTPQRVLASTILQQRT
jgi:hypothetical protein